MTEEEVKRRLPVWMAFADLFLDNKTQPYEYRYIANVCGESGYSREELRHILFHEVGPAFAPNLLQVAGEWGYWPEPFVLSTMKKQLQSPKKYPWPFHKSLTRYAAGEWSTVKALLDAPV